MGKVFLLKNPLSVIFLFFFILTLTRCSSVKFYSDPSLKNETGLRYYSLKPYLLVEYKAEKDNSIKTTIVFLPDISDPQFLVIKPGIGSHELKMNFENSALTSYGLVAESEYPELFESIASMLSKSAYAAQGFGGSETSAQNGSEQNFQLFELISDASGTRLKEVTPLSSNQ